MKDKAVMVIGAGISGIQAATDLANMGFKVYLVESTPSIGGSMAQLDKTFPTNDCAICILAPKMNDCYQHPNIETLTYSEVIDCEGSLGSFKVEVKKKPRYVDIEKCTGCGECVQNCLVSNEIQLPEFTSVMDDLTEEMKSELDEIISEYSGDVGPLIPVLQDINQKYNYLPELALRYVSERLEIPLTQVYNVATFYTAFSLTPRGKHLIKVCQGTACHVRGAAQVLDEIKRTLGIEDGETTEDMNFTLETVNCLGACALGPVVVIDDEYHPTSPAKVDKLLKKYKEEDREVDP